MSSLDDFVPDPNKRDPLELELGPDGGEFSGYRTEQDIDANPDAFREFYKLTGLNPDEWPLEGGSLRVSMWQQSKRLENGQRDLVWLRSYRGRLRRTTRAELTPADIAGCLQIAERHTPVTMPDALPATRVVIAGDAQVGKVDHRGGTPELLARAAELLANLDDVAAETPCERALILDPGDIIEGFENHAAQLHTNDLSLPEQQRVARGLLTDIVSSVAARHAAVTVATCPSNHGAWRVGKGYLGKPGDDFGLDVHRSVADILKRDPRFGHVGWVDPGDEWDEVTYLDERGHVIALTHGHNAKRPDGFRDYWMRQAAGSSKAHAANLIVSGHFHHFRCHTLGITHEGRERTHFQGPAMDGGSAHVRNSFGDEARAGLVTFVLDESGWRDLRLITAD